MGVGLAWAEDAQNTKYTGATRWTDCSVQDKIWKHAATPTSEIGGMLDMILFFVKYVLNMIYVSIFMYTYVYVCTTRYMYTYI